MIGNIFHLKRSEKKQRTRCFFHKKTWFELMIDVLFSMTILFLILILLSLCKAKSEGNAPSFFGFRPYSIQSDSMVPFFRDGDLIIDRQITDQTELKAGDVITFWTTIEGQRVLNSHRIVEVYALDDQFVYSTKGDACEYLDVSLVHQSAIVGKYVFHIPFLGGILDLFRIKPIFILLILVPFLVYMAKPELFISNG